MTDGLARRIAVTGVNGFVGRHVAQQLADAGHEVVGLGNDAAPHPAIASVVTDYVSGDLSRGFGYTERLDGVVHLAGLAAIGPSFDAPQKYLETNSGIVTHLCETLLRTSPGARVIGVSSGSVYGGAGDGPFRDDDPVSFTSPYVVSKVLLENQLAYYGARGIDAVIARPFNHIGPGQGPGFLVTDLAARLAQLGEGEPLVVGNLDSSRDYSDVRDVAAAYVQLLDAPTHEHLVYNVCSGVSVTGHRILELICAAMGRTVPALDQSADQMRVTDPNHVQGDASRLGDELGWRPQLPLEQSIADFLAAAV